jgi:hypothetical protein
VQALKDDEDALDELRIDPDAVIAHRKNPFLIFSACGNVTAGLHSAAQFDRIAGEVLNRNVLQLSIYAKPVKVTMAIGGKIPASSSIASGATAHITPWCFNPGCQPGVFA